MRLIITDIAKIIYSLYKAGEVPVHRGCWERATQPYSLGGRGTIYPGLRPADVSTRSPRMIAECLLTRSMLIKMHYHFMVYVHVQLYLQSVSFMQTFTVKFHKCFCLTQQFTIILFYSFLILSSLITLI